MSHRALFRGITCRNSFVCQSCRSLIETATAPHPWSILHSSRVSQLEARPRSYSRNRKPPPPAGAAAAALLKELTKKKEDEATWRFFEKDESGRVNPLQGEDAYNDSLMGAKEMERGLRKSMKAEMKNTLSKLDKGGFLGLFGIDDVNALAKDFEAQLEGASTPEELLESLEAYIKSLEKQIEEKGFDVSAFDDSNPIANLQVIEATAATDPANRRNSPPIPQIPEAPWGYNQRKRIIRLNSTLKRITKEMRRGETMTVQAAVSVWKMYNWTRPSLERSWASIPQEVWDLLWQFLSLDEANNPNRLTYLSLLARDMSAAKVSLSPSQQLATMEVMFVDGWEAKAMDSWKRCMPNLGDSGADTFQKFWELGVRMFCQKGDLAQAERAVNKLLERQLDPRILMLFIRSCAADSDESSRTKAWDAYRRMRDLLGESMGLEDYDKVISFFLTTDQTELALQAFVDMMSSGTIDVRGMQTLPSSIGNRFFFGKWLKRLIGAEDLEGAYIVFKFMRTKGVEAASIQINGLIGAWQRSGGADNLQKADDLAWEMIKARIEFVKARRRLSGIDAPIRTVGVPGSEIRLAAMPKATLETFSLLAENYRLRRLHDQLEKVWDASREAEVSPDAFMMNQLIESYSQMGNIAEAREVYRLLVHERQVRPDPHTFMALWKMLGINRLHSLSGDHLAEEVQLTRQTFAETIRFAYVFKEEGFDGQFARKVLHSFRRLKDHIGIVIALRAFKEIFNYGPPEMLTIEMLLETTGISLNTAIARQKLQLAKRSIDKFVAQRPRELAQPKTLDEMTTQQRGQELSEYLQEKYIREVGVKPEGLLEQVAKEMGVYDILAKGA